MARALKVHTCSNNIAGIKKPNGNTDVITEAIATHFHEFYTKLYYITSHTNMDHRAWKVTGHKSYKTA